MGRRLKTGARSGESEIRTESDLTGCSADGPESGRIEKSEAPSIKKPGSEGEEASEELLGWAGEEIAKTEELPDEMRALQEDIEVLGRVPVFAVGMLQSKAAVLLGVESFVFNLPSLSTSFFS